MDSLRTGGFSQGVYEISETQKHPLGTLKITDQGKKFRYAQAGAVALAPGKLTCSVAIAADVMNEPCASAHAIGSTTITETITSATYAEDYFKDGEFQVNDGTGQGQTYEIASSTAVTAGTSITITLKDPLKTALVATTSEFTLVHNKYKGVVVSPASTAGAALPSTGVPLVDVTAAYYFWAQTGGVCNVLGGDTAANGACVMPINATSGVAGSVIAMTEAGSVINGRIGCMYGTANVDTEYKPVELWID